MNVIHVYNHRRQLQFSKFRHFDLYDTSLFHDSVYFKKEKASLPSHTEDTYDLKETETQSDFIWGQWEGG